MTKDISIQVNNLGKQYRIGAAQLPYHTIRESITRAAIAPFRRAASLLRGQAYGASDLHEMIWALKDVSFDIKRGEVVGIIGRNGAGKTTLLKILSRITEPTTGSIDLYGRVGSLLEVGTGFHHELTGRENIYLNGAILGMKRSEIERKFDEIVDFAEIGKFIDTPVKHYSSGMYVRLAFAVAAHLEPEILLVDEVLAVGDAAFQKKCLGKMGDVAKSGRTVLFVSHNIAAVRGLCPRVIWIHNGKIMEDGDGIKTTESYFRQSFKLSKMEEVEAFIASLPPDPTFQLLSIDISQNGEKCSTFLINFPIKINIRYKVLHRTNGLRVYFDLLDENEDILIRSFNDETEDVMPTTEPGEYISEATIPKDLLADRNYDLRIQATIYNVRYCTGDGIWIPLTIEHGTGANRAYPQEPTRSKLKPKIPWVTKNVS